MALGGPKGGSPKSAGFRRLFDLHETGVTAATMSRLVVGPGDEGEPVMTILLPNED